MLIKKLLLSSLLFSCAWIISCTDLSGSTSLGENIINDIDPTRTDFTSNFSYSDTSSLISSFSISTPNDTTNGKKELIKVGQSDRIARGSISFEFDSSYLRKHASDSIVSLILQFEPSDTIINYSKSLMIFDYNTLNLLTRESVDTSVNIAVLDSSYDTTNEEWIYKGSIKQNGLESFSEFVKTTPDTSYEYYKFTIVNFDTIMKLSATATLKVKFKNDTTTKTFSSSLSNSVIFDTGSTLISLNSQSITSSETGRKAAFAIDLTGFWTSMSARDSFTTILQATLNIEDSILGDDTLTYIPFRYYITPTLFSDANLLRDSITEYGISSSVNDTDKVSLHAEVFLQRIVSSKPSTVYLYINNIRYNNTIKQETLWRRPSISGVFTNHQ